ncbi:hypothetical protein BW730_11510 [Tessaracoccus aquimaris]|uniref:Uncharacterized protein n=1 Tax=Tessaracoccus aquimaris TaxID=1332264 RepID=A0A1Q2CPI8_9ACTN|nr:hypothetical protein [Tessaracoccus aquimaris]AQP48019.1 hypothetical protein BW730_11510 [Tessaracoccus aquimaris]
MTDVELAEALTLALTGRQLSVGDGGLEAALAEAGFDRSSLADLRHRCQQEQLPWPFAVPIEARRAIGFARFDAALAEARRELGLDGLTHANQAIRPLTRDEQRLADDRPPHWG